MDRDKDVKAAEVKLIAISGGKTKQGGTLNGTCGITCQGIPAVLEGNFVEYPDGSQATVLRDESTTLAQHDEHGNSLTVAATGTMLSNGDMISDAGQQKLGTVIFSNHTSGVYEFDESDIVKMKAEGLL
ncbi:hypothetical protein VH86_08970 [Pantoea sp. BL1]|uniref:hypothetical protein n=1 Tax=Pantoea sp. BL1 TaxID=1628190 RepID=UPI0005F847EE|nr:hypothetical protein [Pantoea sp. BL1]KJV48734.1 hypothetical protein VH86_08970 [Pantoea sp. BL1]